MQTITDLIKNDPNISDAFKSALDRCDCRSTEIYKMISTVVSINSVPQSVVDKPICEVCYYDQLGER